MRGRARSTPAPGQSSSRIRWRHRPSPFPALYTPAGRDYVVFVAGGDPILKPQVGDQVVAYTLGD